MTSFPIRLITTEDGSSSLYREDLNETYHSFHGAKAESDYVFIQQGLDYFFVKTQKKTLSVLEIGFGTGLNAFLSLNYASFKNLQLAFVSLEPIPVTAELYESLNYGSTQSEKSLFQNLHHTPWNAEFVIGEKFSLTKLETTLEKFQSEKSFDLIYFDAFAPSKQPEIWAIENLKTCFDLLNPGGILVTYCAQGQFKRNLREIGFELEILPGALGKKEMVRALKAN